MSKINLAFFKNSLQLFWTSITFDSRAFCEITLALDEFLFNTINVVRNSPRLCWRGSSSKNWASPVKTKKSERKNKLITSTHARQIHGPNQLHQSELGPFFHCLQQQWLYNTYFINSLFSSFL